MRTMSDPEDRHPVDVCPVCRAIESFVDGRCTECSHGICRACLHEPVLVDKDGRCIEMCGGTLTGDVR